MQLHNEQDIVQLITDDSWMMDILKAARTLELPDWWVCAGFVRSKVWDVLHGFEERTPMQDVDVIYYDPKSLDEAVEKEFEQKLIRIMPDVPWSVKNEARMHVINNIPPYASSVDAISKFPETVTALGLSINEQDQVILTAPCGIEDLLNLVLRPTPYFEQTIERMDIYKERIHKKNWISYWPKVTMAEIKINL
ncbi:nucleotidyltransferase family protein [Paenibacillus sp. N1-5-1-14]|uniref:nucleotidyltransferase family protein n=1 Tax=Paenibacillus radicibacter TaxID=2972488 RepID=UPI002158FB23|nr:nucleotidyltransferase family protein [Paenibacillus radicibacter]MCR8644830.1 nucleotidyltransferase family protein [Paenibacillus radicibacter]